MSIATYHNTDHPTSWFKKSNKGLYFTPFHYYGGWYPHIYSNGANNQTRLDQECQYGWVWQSDPDDTNNPECKPKRLSCGDNYFRGQWNEDYTQWEDVKKPSFLLNEEIFTLVDHDRDQVGLGVLPQQPEMHPDLQNNTVIESGGLEVPLTMMIGIRYNYILYNAVYYKNKRIYDIPLEEGNEILGFTINKIGDKSYLYWITYDLTTAQDKRIEGIVYRYMYLRSYNYWAEKTASPSSTYVDIINMNSPWYEQIAKNHKVVYGFEIHRVLIDEEGEVSLTNTGTTLHRRVRVDMPSGIIVKPNHMPFEPNGYQARGVFWTIGHSKNVSRKSGYVYEHHDFEETTPAYVFRESGPTLPDQETCIIEIDLIAGTVAFNAKTLSNAEEFIEEEARVIEHLKTSHTAGVEHEMRVWMRDEECESRREEVTNILGTHNHCRGKVYSEQTHPKWGWRAVPEGTRYFTLDCHKRKAGITSTAITSTGGSMAKHLATDFDINTGRWEDVKLVGSSGKFFSKRRVGYRKYTSYFYGAAINSEVWNSMTDICQYHSWLDEGFDYQTYPYETKIYPLKTIEDEDNGASLNFTRYVFSNGRQSIKTYSDNLYEAGYGQYIENPPASRTTHDNAKRSEVCDFIQDGIYYKYNLIEWMDLRYDLISLLTYEARGWGNHYPNLLDYGPIKNAIIYWTLYFNGDTVAERERIIPSQYPAGGSRLNGTYYRTEIDQDFIGPCSYLENGHYTVFFEIDKGGSGCSTYHFAMSEFLKSLRLSWDVFDYPLRGECDKSRNAAAQKFPYQELFYTSFERSIYWFTNVHRVVELGESYDYNYNAYSHGHGMFDLGEKFVRTQASLDRDGVEMSTNYEGTSNDLSNENVLGEKVFWLGSYNPRGGVNLRIFRGINYGVYEFDLANVGGEGTGRIVALYWADREEYGDRERMCKSFWRNYCNCIKYSYDYDDKVKTPGVHGDCFDTEHFYEGESPDKLPARRVRYFKLDVDCDQAFASNEPLKENCKKLKQDFDILTTNDVSKNNPNQKGLAGILKRYFDIDSSSPFEIDFQFRDVRGVDF